MEAIQSFSFKDALDIFTQLEGDFDSAENRELLTKLGRSNALFERQAQLDEDMLRQLIAQPETGENTAVGFFTHFPLDKSPCFPDGVVPAVKKLSPVFTGWRAGRGSDS